MAVCSKIPTSIKYHTIYKLVHHIAKQVNVPVSTGTLLKGTTGQTLVSSLLPHYLVDFMLLFGVIMRQIVFVVLSTFAYNFSLFV